MTSCIKILGDHPLALDANRKPKSRIATAFPTRDVLVTIPTIHAIQRQTYVNRLNQEREEDGLAPLTPEEEMAVMEEAVDLSMEGDTVQIRPNPDNMALAFKADKLLQKIVAKHQIKFLYVFNEKVRQALTRRGECWRFAPLPTSATEMKRRIAASKLAINGEEIYYYNSTTGTRLLTYQEFAGLAALDDAGLREHLLEIKAFSAAKNHGGNPEIAFFAAGASFSADDFGRDDLGAVGAEELRAAFDAIRRRFQEAVPSEFRQDDPESATWRNRMFSSLVTENSQVVTDEALLGLSPEFHMQVRWLPGGRVVNGELMLDEVFEDADEDLREKLYEETAREFIHNLAREYEDLEYVNIGRIVNSLSRRLVFRGRRDVYLVVVKERGAEKETVNVIRMQKWGMREHLDEGMSLADAVRVSEEYTEYILDRRLGCRHLGMNIRRRITPRRIWEKYVGRSTGPKPVMIWSPYFERAYVRGIATDKVPGHRFQDEAFALEFARLLGAAAAPNMIVGRCYSEKRVLFDDGDEILVENADGFPVELVVTDPSGTFVNFRDELSATAAAYAGPVNRRVEYLPNPDEFARVYLDALVERLSCIQAKFRQRKLAFAALFRNRPYDEAGSLACRWKKVLERLDRSDPRELRELVRGNLLTSVAP